MRQDHDLGKPWDWPCPPGQACFTGGHGQGSLIASLGYSQPDQTEATLATITEKVIDGKPLSDGEGILHHSENIDFLPANIELSGWKPH